MNDPLAPHAQPSGTIDTGTAADRDAAAAEAPAITLPIIAESIDVAKVEVDRGGYRLTKRVEVRDVLVDELLRHEAVEIERRPVHRELAEGEVPVVRYEGDTMIVPVVKEVVVTEKRLVLVEEIHIARVAGTHRDRQTIAVREEHIEIERLGAETPVIRSS